MNFVILILIPLTIFLIGIFGIVLNRKNVLLVIICVELILLAVNFTFLISSFYLDDVLGQIFAIFILVVAAAESSIGLAILITFYRLKGTISINSINKLKG
jgi:NADH:ubiquinone oxidoreductase subunit K|tara:strand:+ start:1791 stop:2093 length:303 start_codon:yes stop_codon:yes gene_type:complete